MNHRQQHSTPIHYDIIFDRANNIVKVHESSLPVYYNSAIGFYEARAALGTGKTVRGPKMITCFYLDKYLADMLMSLASLSGFSQSQILTILLTEPLEKLLEMAYIIVSEP